MKHALTAGALLLATALPLLALPGAGSGAAVAAVFPPWWSGQRAALAAMAAGPVSGFGGTGFVVLLPSGDPARLRQAGAWWILPAALFGGCGPARTETAG
jgi:hypothetical protein